MTSHPRIVAGAALAATAVASGALLLPAGGRAQQFPGRTLGLTVPPSRIAAVDLPPRHRTRHSPNTPGDIVIATAPVSGAASGRRWLYCTALQAGRDLRTEPFACDATYVLSDGTITAAGVVRLEDPRPIEIAVTGGTGAYAGARGTVTAVRGRTETLRLQ